MTATIHLGLPYIAGGQAQKHVTHNEALRRLDAAVQIVVQDRNRTAPPSSPAEGDCHIIASGAAGAWAGHEYDIAFRADGVWDFLTPQTGWIAWSVADDCHYVFRDGAWRPLHEQAIDHAPHIGVNATADSTNRLTVRSNAALLQAVEAADGGDGDARLQISRETSSNTASVFFSDDFSGRAEFGLAGAGAFGLKTSSDGAAWMDAMSVDVASGRVALPRSVAISGVVSPPQITANMNDYAPSGHDHATVFRLSCDAVRSLTGFAGGQAGIVRLLINIGSFNLLLKDQDSASSAGNRFALAGDVTLAPNRTVLLWYDGVSSRWRQIA